MKALKQLQRIDYIFIVAILLGLLLHLLCVFSADYLTDESFYLTVPMRLINGESLVQHEWHVTQFSSLFLYLPVRIFLALKGSTDGILLFARFFYLALHSIASIGIYIFFRKYGIWSVAAALLFYTQVPNRFLALSYNSVILLALLMATLVFLKLYEKSNLFLYGLAGICYGCCCVCNPFYCILFFCYLILCIVLPRKSSRLRSESTNKKDGDTKKQGLPPEQKQALYNRFFGKQAFWSIFAGVGIVAVVSIVFFFATGGTLASIADNYKNMLTDQEHNLSNPLSWLFVNKFLYTAVVFNNISLKLPFLLPAFFLALCFDKNRMQLKHKKLYVRISLVLAALYMVGIGKFPINLAAFAISFPFIIISSVCYILTESKNKKLFYCMWIPGAVCTVVQYFATNVHLTVFWVFAVSNIAGVFFVKDFFEEARQPDKMTKKGKAKKDNQVLNNVCQRVVCIGLCLHLCFQGYTYSLGRILDFNDIIKVNEGPYAGMRLKEKYYGSYASHIRDLNLIQERSQADDPVMILSQFNWLYLYIDRPVAAYSCWMPSLEPDRLEAYFERNPEKQPKYIYIDNQYLLGLVDRSEEYKTMPERSQRQADTLKEMFSCSQEDLETGILLTVHS